MALLVVAVKPTSKRAALAVDGEANDAVRRLLAEALGVAPRAVTLVRGAKARQKAFAVDDLERGEALARLRAFAAAKERVV